MNVDPKDKDRGLYGKFRVSRTDGDPTRKHENCDYFVLDLVHDPHARPALEAYANSCAEAFPALAKDLRQRLTETEPWDLRPDDVKRQEHAANRYNDPG